MRNFSNFNFKIVLIIIFVSFLIYYGYNKNTSPELKKYPKDIKEISIKNDDKFDFYNSENDLILIIADSHLYTNSFNKIKAILDKYNIKLVVHLGDHTDFGSDDELIKAKKLLDELDTNYIALPGDRDLAAYSGDSQFFKVFQRTDSIKFGKYDLLFINNSPNFTPLNQTYMNTVLPLIKKSNIIFTSQPIYVEKGNILESKYMGSPTAFSEIDESTIKNQAQLLRQRDLLLNEIRKNSDKLIVSGDHHRSSFYTDPINETVKYHLVGATAEFLNSTKTKEFISCKNWPMLTSFCTS